MKINWLAWRSQLKGFSLKKKIIIAILVTVFLISAYLAIAIFSVGPSELKLAELRDSWHKTAICHEKCAQDRASQEEIIVRDLESQPGSRAARQLERYFLDEAENISFRAELVRMASRAWGREEAPEYFKEYLASSSGQAELQAEIINSYATAEPLSYYFDLLTSPHDWRLQQAAVNVLSNHPDKAVYFSRDQLARIKKIVIDPAVDSRLRRSLVLLLGDYRSLFPEDTDEILLDVYRMESGVDPISRAFAADILNRLAQEKLSVPDISAAQWDEYYNN